MSSRAPALAPDNARPKGWPLDRDPYIYETAIPGVFAAGDVRHNSVKRVEVPPSITAVCHELRRVRNSTRHERLAEFL